MDGPVKIGCSILPEKRLQDFLAWSPFPLEIIGSAVGSVKDEQFLHCCFAGCHSHREWFYSTPFLRETIKRILASSIDEVRPSLTPLGSIRKGRPRAPWTESKKIETKYHNQLRKTRERLRKDNERGAWMEPDDVSAIMGKWHRSYPSVAEIARLDQYIADPSNHCVLPSWRRPKEPICIPIFSTEEIPA